MMNNKSGKFLGLCRILKESDNLAIYVTQFVEMILDQFWDENFYKLLYK